VKETPPFGNTLKIPIKRPNRDAFLKQVYQTIERERIGWKRMQN
jgi:hypothetical protein